MDIHKRHDPNTLCRTCLKRLSEDVLDTTKHDIFLTPEVVKKLVLCTSLTVEPQDGYPKYLCDCCYTKVNEFHQFQKMCIESTQRFSEILLSREDATGDSIFEDEKNFCDSEAMKMEITIDETDILTQNEDISVPHSKSVKDAKAKISEFVKLRVETEQAEEEEVLSERGDKFDDDIAEKEEDSDLEAIPTSKLKKKSPKKSKSKSAKSATTAISANTFKCDFCHKGFKSKRIFIAHKRQHEDLLPFTCSHEGCTERFNRQSRLIKHLRYTHKDATRNPFMCDQPKCGRRFLHQNSLDNHLLRHACINNCVCPHCGLSKTTQKELRTHMDSHKLERHFPCTICAKVYPRECSLKRHIRLVHENIRNYACSYCDCMCTTRETRRNHELTHTGEKPHLCTECGRRFARPATLKVHEKTHQRQDQSVATSMFDSSGSLLTVHDNTDKRERIFKCQYCARFFPTSRNLGRHIRIVHERIPNYACRYCERKFVLNETLKYHEMTHTGEKPHECTECGTAFRQPASLRKHKKIHLRQQQRPTKTSTQIVRSVQ